MEMDKLEFMCLELEEQVDYYNEQLKQGKTLKEMSEVLEIDGTNIIKRFEKRGYFYNSNTNQYEREIMSDKFSWSKGDIEVIMPNTPSTNEKE